MGRRDVSIVTPRPKVDEPRAEKTIFVFWEDGEASTDRHCLLNKFLDESNPPIFCCILYRFTGKDIL